MEENRLGLALLVLILAVLIKWLVNFCVTVHHLPPGPWGLPVLGYLPWLSNMAFKDFARLGKKYGGMFSVSLGSDMAVVFNDWPSMKAAFVDRGKAFAGRKDTVLTNRMTRRKDVVFSDGETWLKQRNLAIKSIKEVSVSNKGSFEHRMADTIHQITEKFQSLEGQVINVEEVIQGLMALGNWNLISYINVVESKKELQKIQEHVDDIMDILRLDQPIFALPWLRFLPPRGFGFWKAAKTFDQYTEMIAKVIDKHYQQLDLGNDVIDNYIQEIKKHPDGKPPYNKDHLIGTIFNLIIASMETTLSTIMWGLLFLGLNHRVQEKVQEELDRVVGRERLLTGDDFPNLPYLEAFVMETHRMGSVVPLSVPHCTLETVRMNGYTIPKNTLCIQNIYAVHYDPNLWEEPEVFRPERFITKDGSAKAPPYLIPFSIGPRVCLGKAEAEVEMRLVLGCFLQQFSFTLPLGHPRPSLEGHIGITQKPKPFSMQIQCRK